MSRSSFYRLIAKVDAHTGSIAALLAAAALSGCTSMRAMLPGALGDLIRAPGAPQTIRVAVALAAPSVTLSVAGPGTITYAGARRDSRRFATLARVTITCNAAGVLCVNNQPINSAKMTVSPDMPQTMAINGVVYRGRADVLTDGGKVTAVNALPLEEYIMGVVPKETFANWPEEAVRAQAVAARTFAVYHTLNAAEHNYDIVAPMHQLYGGSSSEDPRTTKAVLDTEGETLLLEGAVLCAYFHTCCGGTTEEATNIFPQATTCPAGVTCSYCKNSPHYSWNCSIAGENVVETLRHAGKRVAAPLVAVTPTRRFGSGRVATLRLTTRGGAVDLTGEECRRMLGYNLVRSTLFNVRLRSGRLIVWGHGWGHGVGLCQWGSKAMADAGFSYKDILSFYYPGTQLQR